LETTFLESTVISFLLSLQSIATKPFHEIRDLWESYIYLVHVQAENTRLRAEISRLREERNRLQESYLQSQRLQKLLEFRKPEIWQAIPAEIVGLDASNWTEIVYINQGAEQGIQKGMVVVTHNGVVGQIVQTTPAFAKVMLITDARSSVDALVQRTRARGVVVGRGRNAAEMRYIPLGVDIQEGDRIVSSGMGGIFPKGLEIGVVEKVEKQAVTLFQSVSVLPHVDFSRLEEVLVLTKTE
jgi:rod shape-determining protein MreC